MMNSNISDRDPGSDSQGDDSSDAIVTVFRKRPGPAPDSGRSPGTSSVNADEESIANDPAHKFDSENTSHKRNCDNDPDIAPPTSKRRGRPPKNRQKSPVSPAKAPTPSTTRSGALPPGLSEPTWTQVQSLLMAIGNLKQKLPDSDQLKRFSQLEADIAEKKHENAEMKREKEQLISEVLKKKLKLQQMRSTIQRLEIQGYQHPCDEDNPP